MGVVLASTAMVANAAPIAQDLPRTSSYSQPVLLKNFALSVCLGQVAKDEQAARDAGLTASAYLEFGNQDIDAYDELRKLAISFASRKYSGSVEGEYNTMKCIDLFHSKELDQVVQKWVKRKGK